jgi:low temperature requirement protein LtrA
VAFWWVYFDRAAEDAADVIARSADPGRLGRSAYHLIHPIMVGGIVVAAAADAAVALFAPLAPHVPRARPGRLRHRRRPRGRGR